MLAQKKIPDGQKEEISQVQTVLLIAYPLICVNILVIYFASFGLIKCTSFVILV